MVEVLHARIPKQLSAVIQNAGDLQGEASDNKYNYLNRLRNDSYTNSRS
jgi:hypothetical protein